MWECRRGIIRVSEPEEKIGDSRSTRRCHEGAWMLACRSISILCFHLPSRSSLLHHRPCGNSIIISGKDVKNFSRNFSFQSRTYRRMISQFFQRIDIDIERSSEIFQLPRTKRRVEKGKSVFSPNQLSSSSLLLSLLSSTSSIRKQKWKKNS